jgi:hypothetical protein
MVVAGDRACQLCNTKPAACQDRDPVGSKCGSGPRPLPGPRVFTAPAGCLSRGSLACRSVRLSFCARFAGPRGRVKIGDDRRVVRNAVLVFGAREPVLSLACGVSPDLRTVL